MLPKCVLVDLETRKPLNPNKDSLVAKKVSKSHTCKRMSGSLVYSQTPLTKPLSVMSATEYLDRRLYGLDFRARKVRRDLPAMNGLQMWDFLLQSWGRG